MFAPRNLIAVLGISLFASVHAEGGEADTNGPVTFRAPFCSPGVADACDAYVQLVYNDVTDLSWSVSDAVGDVPINIVDVAQGDKVLASLEGRNGTLESAEDGAMTVEELSSHFCMGHIFAEYEGELYRIDSTDPTTAGCAALMGLHHMDEDHTAGEHIDEDHTAGEHIDEDHMASMESMEMPLKDDRAATTSAAGGVDHVVMTMAAVASGIVVLLG